MPENIVTDHLVSIIKKKHAIQLYSLKSLNDKVKCSIDINYVFITVFLTDEY